MGITLCPSRRTEANSPINSLIRKPGMGGIKVGLFSASPSSLVISLFVTGLGAVKFMGPETPSVSIKNR